MTDSEDAGRPEPEGVIMKYPASVSDRWRFHQDPEYGSETENTERRIVWSGETVREAIIELTENQMKSDGEGPSAGDTAGRNFDRGWDAALQMIQERLRSEEVFSGDE